jgi:hypothetical membrane protein
MFVLAFTVGGAVRPGYSPVRQAISALGVGPNAWIWNGAAVLTGLLLVCFAAGFLLRMRAVVGPGWRWLSATLLGLPGLGLATAAIFTAGGSTGLIHWLVGGNLLFLSPVLAFLVTGLALRRDDRWRPWGTYSLFASLATLLLVVVLFGVSNPRTPLGPTRVGGLAERLVMIEILAWYVVLGWQLFRLPRDLAGVQQ